MHAAPRSRAVILGASNVTRGLSMVAASAVAKLGPSLDLLVAAGHGRSLGIPSRVLLRGIPSIEACGLWPALDESAATPVHALLTDVGNDIMYGQPVERILEWAERCLDRIDRVNAAGATAESGGAGTSAAVVAIAGLPMARLRTLSPSAYRAVRMLLFPRHEALPFSEAMRRAEAVDDGLRALASSRGAAWIAPPIDWYGADPIHVRRGAMSEAWQALLAPWSPGQAPWAASSAVRWLRLRTTLPQACTIAGFRVGAVERPARKVAIGPQATVRLY